MFETIFKNELAIISPDSSLIDRLWQEIELHYNQPGRHYHNMHHLDDLIEKLLQVKDNIHDWAAVVFSVAYHDIIYDPAKKDNEAASSQFACERLTMLALSEVQKHKIVEQISATKDHAVSTDEDTNYLIDADLSILGAAPEDYKNYMSQVRKEYDCYPDSTYYPARLQILERFLVMPSIYQTKFFAGNYETKARHNLSNEIKQITARSQVIN